jgi:uncharacterized protein (DUF2164 family)
MAIKLPKEIEKQLTASIKRYFVENMEYEIGDLKAKLSLDYCVLEIGPSIYNQAIADAQAYMQGKVADVDGALYVPELGYWKKKSSN